MRNISLSGLNVLLCLQVFVRRAEVRSALDMVSTWSSACKGSARARLLLDLEVPKWDRAHLETWIPAALIKRQLVGTAQNGGVAFGGFAQFVLRNPAFVHDPDHEHVSSVVQYLMDDSELKLAGAECLRYHGELLIE